MGAMSIWHWVILLIVAVLVFGTGKLKNLGKDAGSAIRGFKEGLNEEDEHASMHRISEDKNKDRF